MMPDVKRAVAGVAAALVIGGTLTACMSTQPNPMPPGTGQEACGAAELETKLGAPVVEESGRVTVGGEAVSAPGAIRVISPGQPVTQDYSPQRLNLDVDESGMLVRAWCG